MRHWWREKHATGHSTGTPVSGLRLRRPPTSSPSQPLREASGRELRCDGGGCFGLLCTGKTTMVQHQRNEPLIATDEEVALAKEAADKLRAVSLSGAAVRLRVEGRGPEIVLPVRAVKMIMRFLTAMSERRPLVILPYATELSTQEAADFLNVSHVYLIGLLDREELPSRMVGTHRRVRAYDLLAYKEQSDQARRAAIEEMVAEAQRLDLP